MKTMSQVLKLSDCAETLEEARSIIDRQQARIAELGIDDAARLIEMLNIGDSLYVYRNARNQISISLSRKGRSKKEQPVKSVGVSFNEAFSKLINVMQKESKDETDGDYGESCHCPSHNQGEGD